MIKDELEKKAKILEAEADVNDAYALRMERTSEKTGGRLGHLNAPNTYAAHKLAAAGKREQAAKLRSEAALLDGYTLRDIPLDLWNRAKHQAIEEGTNLRGMIFVALEEHLQKSEEKKK